jgi:hypothetical protein
MRQILRALAFLGVVAHASALTITIDETYAAGYFDGNPQAKATMEKAASDLTAALTTSLGAITTDKFTGHQGTASATFDWDLMTRNPSNLSQQITLPTFPFADGVFKIFAGATTAITGDGQTLGAGAPVSMSYQLDAEGTSDAEIVAALQKAVVISNDALSRVAGPKINSVDDQVTIGAQTVNYTVSFGPIAGFLTFDVNESWHFDWQTSPGAGEYDFYTVMLHEMMHSLGLGNSFAWNSMTSNGTDWTGPNVIALKGNGAGLIHRYYNEGTPDQTTDGAHIMPGTMSTTVEGGVAQEAVMTPSIGKGERRLITQLDVAFLKDLGYVPTPTPTPATPTPTPTPEPEAPATPATIGKVAKKVTKPKATVNLAAPTGGAYLEYSLNKGPFVKAKSNKLKLKLLPGKNVILIRSTDPVTGKSSPTKKVVIKYTAP